MVGKHCEVPARAGLLGLLQRFRRDQSGNYAIIAAVAMPVLVGAASFGTEEGVLLFKKKAMQHTADSAAVTAAVSVAEGAQDNGAGQANAVAASYGFTNGANATNVTINSPPTEGAYTNNRSAIEVIVSQPQPRLFSSIWDSEPVAVASRAVAIPEGSPCILALNRTVSGAYSQQGSVDVNSVKCSVIVDSSSGTALNIGGASRLSASFVGVVGGTSGESGITTEDGTITGYHYVADPYAGTPLPAFSGCDHRNYSTHGDVALSPGVYCGGIALGAQAHARLSPGIYILDQGSLTMTGQSSLSGNGVTLVFTSSSGSDFANASITGGATIDIVAPASGPTAGIAIFGDRRMPVSTTFKFTGGDAQLIGGALYVPSAALKWAGNSSLGQRCTQLVADTIEMAGNSGLRVSCEGFGTKPLGTPAILVE